MADATKFNARIQIPMDTEDGWETTDPVLLKGEIVAVSTDDGVKLKVGDGISTYSALAFLS